MENQVKNNGNNKAKTSKPSNCSRGSSAPSKKASSTTQKSTRTEK